MIFKKEKRKKKYMYDVSVTVEIAKGRKLLADEYEDKMGF